MSDEAASLSKADGQAKAPKAAKAPRPPRWDEAVVDASNEWARTARWAIVAAAAVAWSALYAWNVTTTDVACLEAGHTPKVCSIEYKEQLE